MDEGDGHGAFTDGGSATLDGAVTNVAGGEDTGHAGFEVVGSALKRPLGGKNAVGVEVGSGDEVAVFVATDADGGGPFGVRLTAETKEEEAGVEGLRLASLIVRESDGAEHEVAVKRGDLRLRKHFDFWASLDAVDEVLGEGGFQTIAANDDSNFFGGAGEVHGSLSGRITATNDENVFIDTKVGFAGPSAVEEADVEEFFFVGKAETSVADAGAADGGVSDDGGAVCEVADSFAGKEFTTNPFTEHENFRAEASSLLAGSLGEIGAADALGKSEIVFNSRAGAGLASDDGAFNDHGFEALGSGVDSGAESGGAGAVDRDVVFGARGIAEPAKFFDDLAIGGTLDTRAIGKDAEGQALIARARDAEFAIDFVRSDFSPFEGDVGAMKEIADGVSAPTFVAPVNPDGLRKSGDQFYRHRVT